jgi:hypothetical protein
MPLNISSQEGFLQLNITGNIFYFTKKDLLKLDGKTLFVPLRLFLC